MRVEMINGKKCHSIEAKGKSPDLGWCSICANHKNCTLGFYAPCSPSERDDERNVYFIEVED